MRSSLIVLLVLAAAAAPARGETRADRDAARARYRQGNGYYERGKYQNALAEFEAAYALAPRPLLLYHLGRCYQALGRDAEARTAFERFLAAEPKGGPSGDARARLARLSAPPPPAPPPPVEETPRPPPPVTAVAPAPEPPPRFAVADEPPPRRSGRPRWPWLGAGGVALAGGLVLDLAPSSSKNGELDALDLVPVALYAFAATAVYLGLR